MNYQKLHTLEKIQVEIAAGIALALTYFVIGPISGSWDPLSPSVFVANASFQKLFAFGVLVWTLAAGCSLLTMSSRPQGAMIAALVGAAGISLHSRSIQGLFMEYQESHITIFMLLIVETLILLLFLFATEAVVYFVRHAMARFGVKWLFRGRVFRYEPHGLELAEWIEKTETADTAERIGFLPIWAEIRILRKGDKANARETLTTALSCMGMSILIATVLLLVLLQSSERGQVIAGIFISFVVAVLASHQKFPTPFAFVAWSAPMLTAILFYILSAATVVDSSAVATGRLHAYALGLPVDWMTAGGAGAVLGFWVSERIHELRHIESHMSDK